jgi:hypothetical protein
MPVAARKKSDPGQEFFNTVNGLVGNACATIIKLIVDNR